MTNLTHGWSGAVTPADNENFDPPADFLQLANTSAEANVPHFATSAAAAAAAATFIAADATWRGAATIEDRTAIYHYMGPDDGWVWIGHIVPVEFTSQFGTDGSLSGSVSPVAFPSVTYLFTPTRSGYAEVWAEIETRTITTGFGAAYAKARIAQATVAAPTTLGSVSDLQTWRVLHQQEPWRTQAPFKVFKNVRMTNGVNVQLTMSHFTDIASGAWSIVGVTWHVVFQ